MNACSTSFLYLPFGLSHLVPHLILEKADVWVTIVVPEDTSIVCDCEDEMFLSKIVIAVNQMLIFLYSEASILMQAHIGAHTHTHTHRECIYIVYMIHVCVCTRVCVRMHARSCMHKMQEIFIPSHTILI